MKQERLGAHRLVAPELVDLEVMSGFRLQLAHGRSTPQRVEQALIDLTRLQAPTDFAAPTTPSLLELRDN